MFLRKEVIESLLTEIYSNSVEICGNLGENDSTHELKIIYKEVGLVDPKTGRNLCIIPKDKRGMTSYLYHTHPNTAYAYPSFEDIWTVVKERDKSVRFSSFIFTIWGVWILMPNSNRKIDETEIAEIKSYYERKIYEFHAAQKGASKSKDYDGDIQTLIDTYIEIVEKTFKQRVSVRFVSWEKLREAEEFQI
jgi:hypothetical protein